MPGAFAGFSLPWFEGLTEAFMRARQIRALQHTAGVTEGLRLNTLYGEDFPALTSLELYADLHEAQVEDPRHHRELRAFLVAAELEGRTRDLAGQVAAWQTRTMVPFEDSEIPWRAVPMRWGLLPEAPRRHALQEAWRDAAQRELDTRLQRWQEAQQREVPVFGEAAGADYVALLDDLHALSLARLDEVATNLLATSDEVFRPTLAVYLAQLELPIDDAWTSDVEWAFRATRFDDQFPGVSLMPAVVKTLGDLGITLDDLTSLKLGFAQHAAKAPGVHVVPVGVPEEVHVLMRAVGGYRDYQRLLCGLGEALHAVFTDRTLPVADRWLGDASTSLAYGLLLEGLTRETGWLHDHLLLDAVDDYRVVAHLGWLYRVRQQCALLGYTQRLWRSDPDSTSLATDFDETFSAALHTRHFGEEHRLPLLNGPWQPLRAATRLRAELLAAHLRDFLRREYDADWRHNPRAGRFLVQELWRPGRRYTAEDLLGYMGYEGFDPGILWSEIAEVLRVV